MSRKFTLRYADQVVEVPGRFEVCSKCQGEGTQLYGSLDGLAIPAEHFAEDPDFAEDYFGGRYDVQCSLCNGKRVELVPDVENMTFGEKRHYVRWLKSEARRLQEEYDDRMTRWYESGCPQDDCGPIYPGGY
jgi:hypothetical protein